MRTGRRAALLALAAAALVPSLSRAARRKRVLFVDFGPVDDGWKAWRDPFAAELARRGFVEGRDIEIVREALVATGRGNGPEVVAAQLARRIPEIGPDVIVTQGPIVTIVAQLATRSVPIVAHTSDPVGAGFAQSIARPGGNITGVADGVEETSAKTMELVKQLIPRATRLAIFSDPRPAASRFAANFERAARSAGIEPVMILSKRDEDYVAALRELPARKVAAGLLAWTQGHPRRTAEEAIAARVPLFAPDHDWVRFGFLGAYSAHEPAPEAGLAAAAAQILRGAKPGDIPFVLPRHFRLVLNRRTADAVGVRLPPDLLLRADRVIE
ncbi:MAG: ABC transporter substrate-binding protein [Lysobacter sp.]|nr:ABC transporter substrate-binding protein [Lysobacter sp.]